MTRLKSFSFSIIALFFCFSATAQRGFVSGKIIDSNTGEALASATITTPTSSGGGYSNLEGVFNASFAVGTHNIEIKLMGYDTSIIANVVVLADSTTYIDVVKLSAASAEEAVKGGVLIIIKRKTDSDAAILADMKNSVNLQDGTGAKEMSKVGAGNAAAAAQRVTGVSIDGGKYAFVRGLGDRYTKTVLNSMELPGLDPDRNTVQMDIFPTNLIDNIKVLKSFTPNLAGDFTGGWVDVKTKDFQAREIFEVSASLGFNPAMNLTGDYFSYQKSTADVFALGAGSRKLPFAEERIAASLWATNGEKAQDLVESFDKTMSPERKTSLLNSSFSLSYGNQKDTNGRTFGYNLAMGYSNSYTYYDQAIYETYLKNLDATVNELTLATQNNGSVGENEVLWSALANGSKKKGKHSFTTTLFHTQNGINKSSLLNFENINNPFGDAGARLDKGILYYNQRRLTSLLLRHTYGDVDTSWKITSSLSPSLSSNNEPDMRITALSPDENGYRFNVGAGSEVSRIYRRLDEIGVNAKVDFERSFKLKNDSKTKVLFGAANNVKSRQFGVVKYTFQAPTYAGMDFSGDPSQIFEEFLFDNETGDGFNVSGGPVKANFFDAWMNVAGGYVMNELPLMSERINLIYGVRVEKADMYYTGSNTNGQEYTNENVLNELNVLPSFNFLFKATPKINIRAAATRTLARPSFKEKSLAQIIDPISGRTFIGTIDLLQTDVTNFDFRFEWYMNRGEILSIGAFYKDFTNPIETVVYTPETPTNFTPRNAASAKVYGVEFEIKKALSRDYKNKWSQLFVATNVSYIISEVTMTPKEIEGKTNELRVGQVLGTTREMQGQAPYIVNASVNYDGRENGLNMNVSYNVQGPKLAIVGIGRVADVYTESFHSLNAKVSYEVGKEKRAKWSVGVTNILADDKLQVYRSYQAQDQIFTQLLPSRTFKVGFSYKIK